jgi:hypothetical protein
LNSSQNSPGDEEAGEEDGGQEGGEPPFMPNDQPSELPFPPPEEPLHTASSPPIGLPTPERPLSPSGSLPPPRILRNASPNPPPPQPLPNRLHIIRRIRIYPLRPRPRLRFPRRPPAPPPADGDRAHSQAPPPPSREAHLHSPKRALWSLFASHAHRSLLPPRVCPKIVGQLLAVVLQRGEARQNWDTPPSPLFSPPPVWNQSPPPPPSPFPAYPPSPEGLAGSGARLPSPGVPETAAKRSDRRHMGGAYRTTGSLQPAHTGSR